MNLRVKMGVLFVLYILVFIFMIIVENRHHHNMAFGAEIITDAKSVEDTNNRYSRRFRRWLEQEGRHAADQLSGKSYVRGESKYLVPDPDWYGNCEVKTQSRDERRYERERYALFCNGFKMNIFVTGLMSCDFDDDCGQ